MNRYPYNRNSNHAIGGRFATLSTVSSPNPLSLSTPEMTDQDDVYSEPVPIPPKKHGVEYLARKVKVRQLAEEPLKHLSDELFKLTEAVRYLDPLVAEALDEALSSTEMALDILARDE